MPLIIRTLSSEAPANAIVTNRAAYVDFVALLVKVRSLTLTLTSSEFLPPGFLHSGTLFLGLICDSLTYVVLRCFVVSEFYVRADALFLGLLFEKL